MVSAARKAYGRISSGKLLHPFDPLNDTAFYSLALDLTLESERRLFAQARVAAILSEIGSKHVKRNFGPTPMSNGLPSYEYLLMAKASGEKVAAGKEDGLMTTQDIKYQIAPAELVDRMVLPNRFASHRKGDRMERSSPDEGAMVVTDFESPIRATQEDQALSGGAHFRDNAYELYWVAAVYRSHRTTLEFDHAASRNANAEEIAADFIQTGLVDDIREGLSPGREYPIADMRRRDVPLSDRAWETAKHIFDVREHGFKSDFAVNALIARFQIHDWLKDPANSPLDMDAVHPVLKKRTPEDVARMDRLKEIMLPYLADKCMRGFPLGCDPARKAYVDDVIMPQAGKFDPARTDALREELFAHRPKGGANAFLHRQYNFAVDDPGNDNGLSGDFSAATRRVKRRGTDGTHFRFHGTTRKFDDKENLFRLIRPRERAAIGFAAGAMEAVRMPENAPGVLFVACHPKGGTAAKEWMDERGILDLAEAQSASDVIKDNKSYAKDVMRRNAKQDEKFVEEVYATARARGAGEVLSTLDFLEAADVMAENHEFVAAEGPPRLSSNAVLALQLEWFDRNATGIVLREGWQYHPSDVTMALRAVQHATGLISREDVMPGGTFRMDILDHNMKPMSLHDIAAPIFAHVEACLDAMPPVNRRENYVEAIRLLEIIDMLGDPGHVNFTRHKNHLIGKIHADDIIDWGKVNNSLHAFWDHEPEKKRELSATRTGAAQTLRDRLREKLLERGIHSLEQSDLKGLDDEFTKKWDQVKGLTDKQSERASKRGVLHVDHGSTS